MWLCKFPPFNLNAMRDGELGSFLKKAVGIPDGWISVSVIRVINCFRCFKEH
jgi:hypothetical protein